MKKVKTRKTKKMSAKSVARLTIKTVKVWMVCSVPGCHHEVLVDKEEVIKVKCSLCTLAMAPVPKRLLEQRKEKAEKPAGWRFMKLFIDKDGNVFHTGVVQPKLKGTLKPSNVDKIREDQKKKREETKKKKELREKLKDERLVKQHVKAKKAKKKAQDKKDGKVTKRKKVTKKSKKKAKKKNTNSVRYEKFEENKIATDREQIEELIKTESTFAEHLSRRDIDKSAITKIARTSYEAIDTKTGTVKNKRRGYKVSLETGGVKIINISIK